MLPALARSYADTISDDGGGLLAAGFDGTEFGRYFLTYVMRQLKLTQERLRAAIERLGLEARDMKAMVGTIAEEIHEEGRAEGKAESLLRLARLKFGEIPPDRVEQVRGAASGELDIWLDALFSAEDLDAVFAARSFH